MLSVAWKCSFGAPPRPVFLRCFLCFLPGHGGDEIVADLPQLDLR
jgi:hypothetical protein